jgi:hypothetical protein
VTQKSSSTLTALGEFGFISRITARVAPHESVITGIGDDAAVTALTPGMRLLTSTDMLLENVHFRRTRHDPYTLGRKSLAVSISDIAAMGGIPRWALLSVALPPDLPLDFIDEFMRGFHAEHAFQRALVEYFAHLTQNVVGDVDATFDVLDGDALHVVGVQRARLTDSVIDGRLAFHDRFRRILGIVKSKKIQSAHQRFRQLIELHADSFLRIDITDAVHQYRHVDFGRLRDGVAANVDIATATVDADDLRVTRTDGARLYRFSGYFRIVIYNCFSYVSRFSISHLLCFFYNKENIFSNVNGFKKFS